MTILCDLKQILNERKKLISVETTEEMWTSLKSFCKLLSIDDTQLLLNTSKSVLNNSTNKLQSKNEKSSLPNTTQLNNAAAAAANGMNLPLTPQTTSSSSTCSSSSTSSCENIKNNNTSNLNEAKFMNGHKRPSSSSSSTAHNQEEDHSSAKLLKQDSTSFLPITDWNIEQVVFYISQLSDNYFSSYTERFRHHEIDGKALVLLTTDILMKYMGFKLGPALKLNNYLDKLRRSIQANLNNQANNQINKMANEQSDNTECT